MSVLIAHASIDEHGSISNGTAGDQSGKEVCVRSWYNKPWQYLIRFNDSLKAERLARCMESAASNVYIGYDQNQRNSLLKEARKYNYDVSKVNVPCETDCSALVSVACMYAGVYESALTLRGNCCTTRTLRQALKATGLVSVYSSPLYVNNTDRLMRGDILLKEGSHVVVVVKAESENPYKLSKISLTLGCKGESVKWLQWELNKRGANLDVDGIFGKHTKLSVMLFQKAHVDDKGAPLKVDGIAGSKTIAALKRK